MSSASVPPTSPGRDRLILACDCQGTIPLDRAGDALSRGCPVSGGHAHELCRAQLDRFREALSDGRPVTVACTQEAPLFEEVAAESRAATGAGPDLSFANIRELAGWSDEGAESGPKMAALIAMAAVQPEGFATVALESRGVTLVLGRDEIALEAAGALADTLDITLLMLPRSSVTPPRQTVFPIWQGRVSAATGHLGSFELTVDDFAAPLPSSRAVMEYGPARSGAVSRADLVLDLTGGTPVFAADELRPGYLRADPRDPLAVARLIDAARQMVGVFDKPRYIEFRTDLCAHSRNRIEGCTRCLPLCPTGAITPDGDSVSIDPAICAGCGQCAAVCPTGAASYAVPPVATVAEQLRAGLEAWHRAAAPDDAAPVVLFHDTAHGAALIEACARFGPGLPARVLPVALTEITRLAPEMLAAAQAYGASCAVLAPDRPRHDLAGLEATLDLIAQIAVATGRPAPTLIRTDDPDRLADETRALPELPLAARRSAFLPPADKRGLLVAAMAEAIRTAPTPADRLALSDPAPFGAVLVDPDLCVLCHACTGACPTGALLDNPEAPMLRFTESACVQCGICAATCPENAITLEPRISLPDWDQPRRILHEEPQFACTDCGKPFGTASAIARVQEKLAGHWMFSGPRGDQRLRLLTMCEDCRAVASMSDGLDPHEAEPLH